MLAQEVIIIQGVLSNGEPFRPSDWADRLAGRLSTFINRRIVYSPLLRPGIHEGNRCVFIDPSLAVKEPALFWEVVNFAKTNGLKIDNKSKLLLEL